jgi:hypothetical protein
MSLQFRYKPIWAGRMLPSLGGRTVRPRPLIQIGLTGPTGTTARAGLFDTGADDVVFPDLLAVLVGIDLTAIPVSFMGRPGGQNIPVRYVDVSLRLSDGREHRQWPATVAFTSAPLPYPLLGFAGFLRFFTATFRGDTEEVELAVNALYPGT